MEPNSKSPRQFAARDVGEACPLPDAAAADRGSDAIARMLAANRIAVVGLSDDPNRPSYGVAQYLLSVGKQVVPINPNCKQVLGRTCYVSLADVPGPIGLVNVFRRPEHCAEVARQAIAAGAKGLWLQSGIRNADARRLAADAGVDYVEDRCLMVEHYRRKG